MGSIKTAISIDEPLFEQVENLAHELNISRSRIFAMAVTEFIQRHRNQQLLEAINAAYDDVPEISEESLQSKMRSKQLKMVRDQW